MPTILLHLLPATLYALLGIHFWRTRWTLPRRSGGGRLTPAERGVELLALGAHGYVLYDALFKNNAMHFSFGIALSMMLWLTVLFYWVESLYAKLDGLQALIMPAAAFCTLVPVLFPEEHVLVNAASPEFRAHFVVAMLAYSLFTLAALHAMLIALAQRRLHQAQLNQTLANLPPLITMERLLFRLIGIAFVLLSLTLVSGILFSESLFGTAFTLNHKTLFAIISWLLFAALLLGRRLRGWRGKVALRWTLAGFAALMLAYVGSRFVLEVVLGRVS